jgi:hypothetical protein
MSHDRESSRRGSSVVRALGPILTVRYFGAAARQMKNVYLVCPMLKNVASTCVV